MTFSSQKNSWAGSKNPPLNISYPTPRRYAKEWVKSSQNGISSSVVDVTIGSIFFNFNAFLGEGGLLLARVGVDEAFDVLAAPPSGFQFAILQISSMPVSFGLPSSLVKLN